MNKIALIFLMMFAGISHSSELLIEYASNLKELISNNDISGLKGLNCYPKSNHCVNDQSINYIFSSKNAGILKILQNPEVKVKLFGPYTYEDSLPNQTYSIVYYIPQLVTFNKKGFMDSNTRELQWNKGYAETLVTIINGNLHLHRTIFYYGAHLPWAGDYG